LPRRILESERGVRRIVEPEWLDSLPSEDPRAIRSRRDLRRVNGWMRNRARMADALQAGWNRRARGRITELGAGDGDFLLRVARRLNSSRLPPAGGNNGYGPGEPVAAVTATLLDREQGVSVETLAAFAALGWRAQAVVADAFEWLPVSDTGGVVIANLFLHHFEGARLVELLRLISQRAELFIAIEPERAPWTLFCSRLLWAIGCNAVTRHDAVVSVRAGFSGRELTGLWPDQANWQLVEHRTRSFSHLFTAQKVN
jgi:hypothetical protein